jgi:phytoene dehydrogenase-like protein
VIHLSVSWLEVWRQALRSAVGRSVGLCLRRVGEMTVVPDVLVVGAGVAGLACAADLCAAGLSVRVLEAGDEPGGRMRTDVRDGFRLDRGFQVFNTDYPQVRRRVDVAGLDLRRFTSGYLVRTPAGLRTLGHPLRVPAMWRELIPGRLGSPADFAKFAALCLRDLTAAPSRIKTGTETTTRHALEHTGLSDGFIDTVLRPFFAGVFLDTELETSSRMLHLVWRSMLRGTIGLPAAGIGAVPRQLAAGLPPGVLELERPVSELTDTGALLADGSEVAAHHVVVATDPAAAAGLLPDTSSAESKPVTTYYHAAPLAPLDQPVLLVDAGLGVLNTVVISNAAPGCAPRGYALIATSLAAAEPPDEATVRERLAALYETDTAGWQEVATYRIPRALPRMSPPWPLTRDSRVGPRRYVCGDHRATGSVQGAMASGARAAREVLADRRAAHV